MTINSAYLTPRGGFRYLLSIAASNDINLSLANSIGFFVFSYPPSAGIQEGRKLTPSSMVALPGTFQP